jgi:hypothetical protein
MVAAGTTGTPSAVAASASAALTAAASETKKEMKFILSTRGVSYALYLYVDF